MDKQNRIKIIFALVLMVLVEIYLGYLFVDGELKTFKFTFYTLIMGALFVKNLKVLLQKPENTENGENTEAKTEAAE